MSNNVDIGNPSAKTIVFLVLVIGPTYVKSNNLATGNPSTINVDDPVHIEAPHPYELGPPQLPQEGPIKPQHVSNTLAANICYFLLTTTFIVSWFYICICIYTLF